MLQLRLTQVSLAYGDHALIDRCDLSIHKGERIGILGHNGAGKSTFMKLLHGSIEADSGELWRADNLKTAWLDQSLPAQSTLSVYEFIADGLEGLGALLARYHALTQGSDFGETALTEMGELQKQIEQQDGWSSEHRIEAIIDRLALPADAAMDSLSGGNRRRAALGRALVSEPDILMLDEPTNHLDIPTIGWLEGMLAEFQGTVIVITHDRRFLQQVSRRIIEIDRGRVRAWDCNYERFLELREQLLDAEDKANSEFDRKLAEEERWIRQGIKARRTRNEGRVRALEQMRHERQQRREGPGKARFAVEQAARSGKIVIEAENISFSHDERPIVRNFSTRIMRGDRIGLIGANGCGKSTLLKLLLGELQPQSGEVKIGSNLELLYFDQLRAGLDERLTVMDYLAEGREFITLNGKQRHVISYLQDFLFPPRRVRQPIAALSGGEQNRLILAKLFSKPANLMVLDEPTNDLDMETLELLEEILLDFDGTVLLVSHDRSFLDNVVTSSIVFEGPAMIREYVGGYEDWLRQGGSMAALSGPGNIATKPPPPAQEKVAKTAAAAVSAQSHSRHAPQNRQQDQQRQKQQKQLDRVTAAIEKLEARIEKAQQVMAEPGFYDQDSSRVEAAVASLAQLQQELEARFSEWEELEQD